MDSIQGPSQDAAQVFYRVITRTSGRRQAVDDLLETLPCPLLLCWGEQDPWPVAADTIQRLYPQRVSMDACPHDEAAPAVNAAIQAFVQQVNENR